MQLMAIAQGYASAIYNIPTFKEPCEKIIFLLSEIEEQQSDELNEVE